MIVQARPDPRTRVRGSRSSVRTNRVQSCGSSTPGRPARLPATPPSAKVVLPAGARGGPRSSSGRLPLDFERRGSARPRRSAIPPRPEVASMPAHFAPWRRVEHQRSSRTRGAGPSANRSRRTAPEGAIQRLSAVHPMPCVGSKRAVPPECWRRKQTRPREETSTTLWGRVLPPTSDLRQAFPAAKRGQRILLPEPTHQRRRPVAGQ